MNGLYGDQSIYDDLIIRVIKPMVIKKMVMCPKACCHEEIEVNLEPDQVHEVERFMIDEYEIGKDYILL